MIYELTKALDIALEAKLGYRLEASVLYWPLRQDYLVEHWQRKQPDSQLRIKPEFAGTRVFPALIVEIGSRHASL